MQIQSDYLNTIKDASTKNIDIVKNNNPMRSKTQLPNRKRQDSLILPDRLNQVSKPTVSINLDPTVSHNSAASMRINSQREQHSTNISPEFSRRSRNTSISNNYDNNLYRNHSNNILDRITIRSYNPSIYSTNIDANHAINYPFLNEGDNRSFISYQSERSNFDAETLHNALIDRLTQGMSSIRDPETTQTKNSNTRVWKQPYVSNEIPNVFQNLTKVNPQTLNSSTDIPNGSTTDLELSEPKELVKDLKDYDKNFFILTAAGKPVFSMYGSDAQVTSYVGIITTVINYFKLNNSSNIKSIKSPHTNQIFVFLDKSPIIFMAVSKLSESRFELTSQLDFIYSYLLSSTTKRYLDRLFEKKESFDLRNFLETSDFQNLELICSLITKSFYPNLFLGSLQSLELKRSTRAKLHNLMIKHLLKESSLPKGTLLYGLLLAPGNKLVSVLRPRGHTLHTTDLQLLFTLITHRFQKENKNREFWVPICFSKFNSNGFLYCYMKFLTNGSSNGQEDPLLVLISAQKDSFFELKKLGGNFLQSIHKKGLDKYLFNPRILKITDIPAPLIHHFIYKSKKHVQFVMPDLEISSNYNDMNSTEAKNYSIKLKNYYQQLCNSVLDENGNPLNSSISNFIRWEADPNFDCQTVDNPILQEERPNMLGLAWITNSFELYIICNNGVLDKSTVFKSAKKIVEWCKSNEERLFVSEGAVF